MSYSGWKATRKSAGALQLDPANPRIPPSSKTLSQSELITELVTHDDVYQLALNIQANGFFPTEPLVAIREKGKYYVAEGNRRLAACKLLANPDAAPEDFRSRFKLLSAKMSPTEFDKIPVVVAPNRDSTVPIIIARHTLSQIARWEPAMQASFYYRLVSAGLSVEDVANKFGLPAARIREGLHSHNLYQMACRLKLPVKVADHVRNPREFNLTTLTRVFDSPHGRDFFGIELAPDGKISGKIPPQEFQKGFARLVKDLASGDADSRTLNSPAQIKEYLEDFGPTEKPDLSKKGSFDSDSFLTKGKPAKAKLGGKPTKKPKPSKNRGLVPSDFVCNLKGDRIRDVLIELKILPPEKFPNAIALAFRCFLELCVHSYLNQKGEIKNMENEKKAEIQTKNLTRKPGQPPLRLEPHWTPTLNEMLNRIVDPNRNLLSDNQVAKAMKKTLKDEQDLFALNLYTHNPNYHPSGPKLRNSWKHFDALLRLVAA